MKNIILFSVFSFFCFSINVNAQDSTATKPRYTAHNKGKFTIAWGGNRDYYSKSDITFQGDYYDFTIDNAVAHDKPKGWNVDYITPGHMTTPQTNFKAGYFFTDHYSISLGEDHMKYVMTQNQTANVTGYIAFPESSPSAAFNGVYDNTPTVMTEDFLMFEHTDGLNYVYAEIARQDDISHIFGITNTDKFQVNINEGFGIGALYPKTNTTLMGQPRHDDFNVAGFGTSIKAGLNFTIFKYFTIEGDLKGGYINMPNIRTTQSSSDSAHQEFFFFETIVSFGGIFRL